MREVDLYKRENGRKPVKEFLKELSPKLHAKTVDLLVAVETNDAYLSMPHSKYMEDDIYEFRIRFASDIARVFYFFFHKDKIILTNGFVKKSQKTPPNELKRAKEYKKDYERRMSNNEY